MDYKHALLVLALQVRFYNDDVRLKKVAQNLLESAKDIEPKARDLLVFTQLSVQPRRLVNTMLKVL